MVEFIMRDRAGSRHVLSYDPARHCLSYEGSPLVLPGREAGVAPDKPAPVGRYGRLAVRLVLGKNCNFRCAYCCQHLAGKRHEAAAWDFHPVS